MKIIDLLNKYCEIVYEDKDEYAVIVDNLHEFLIAVNKDFKINHIYVNQCEILLVLYNVYMDILIKDYQGCLFSDEFDYVSCVYIDSSLDRILLTGGKVKCLQFGTTVEPKDMKYIYSQFKEVKYVARDNNIEKLVYCGFPNIHIYNMDSRNKYLIYLLQQSNESKFTVKFGKPFKGIDVKYPVTRTKHLMYNADCSFADLKTYKVEKLFLHNFDRERHVCIKHIFCNPHIKKLYISGFTYQSDYYIKDLKNNHTLVSFIDESLEEDMASDIEAIMKRNKNA